MEIKIQFVQLPKSDAVESFATRKLLKMAKKYEWLIKADVFYKLEPDKKGKGKICEIRLSLPGPRIFAFSDEESYEIATDETIRDIEKQLQKRKSEIKPYI
ncbi:HPF/RaiA family ribosome-associated protein [Lutibacter sp.]|uniref:HPF/RaiA family ribosome-associated protein n=1 Tax=Lutibacter sp. TaxID=1925666 RepID=UPI0035648BF6